MVGAAPIYKIIRIDLNADDLSAVFNDLLTYSMCGREPVRILSGKLLSIQEDPADFVILLSAIPRNAGLLFRLFHA